MATLTLADIKAKLPAAWGPIIDQYGPAFLAMTEDEIWAWLTRALQGDMYDSYMTVLAKLPNADLLTAWEKNATDWQAQNVANAASISWQKDALTAILRVLVVMATAIVGF
jgi:hypothetical protein